jgi:hypothetical protein
MLDSKWQGSSRIEPELLCTMNNLTGVFQAWEGGAAVTTRGNRPLHFNEYREALVVIWAQSLLVGSIAKS